MNGVVYFPDWAGNLFAVNAETGRLIWSHQFSDYGLTAGTVSRPPPTIADGVLYIGTQYNAAATQTGWLLAINPQNGRLIWKTQPDTSNAFPVITSAPVEVFGIVYVGMTSNEEFAAANPAYPCCSARGSVVAVSAYNGAKLWQTFTVPTGYTGGAVWGSNPVVDLFRGTLYVGTGDNYSHPTDPVFLACIAAGGSESSCLPANDHVDSILALDMWTGRRSDWSPGISMKWPTAVTTGTLPALSEAPTVPLTWRMNPPGPITISAPRRMRSPTGPAMVSRPSSEQDKRVASTMPSIRIPERCFGRPR